MNAASRLLLLLTGLATWCAAGPIRFYGTADAFTTRFLTIDASGDGTLLIRHVNPGSAVIHTYSFELTRSIIHGQWQYFNVSRDGTRCNKLALGHSRGSSIVVVIIEKRLMAFSLISPTQFKSYDDDLRRTANLQRGVKGRVIPVLVGSLPKCVGGTPRPRIS